LFLKRKKEDSEDDLPIKDLFSKRKREDFNLIDQLQATIKNLEAKIEDLEDKVENLENKLKQAKSINNILNRKCKKLKKQ
jgi:peptidoglycan hydrolase CwlO-like protein